MYALSNGNYYDERSGLIIINMESIIKTGEFGRILAKEFFLGYSRNVEISTSL